MRRISDLLLVFPPETIGFVVTLLSGMVLTGVALLMLGIRRFGSPPCPPCCARCGYRLDAEPGPSASCSECGADLTRTGSVRTRLPRTRGGLLALGAIVAVSALLLQWALGVGWLAFGTRATEAARERRRLALVNGCGPLDEVGAGELTPGFVIACAIGEFEGAGATVAVGDTLITRDVFASAARLEALRKAIEDPGTRSGAFGVLCTALARADPTWGDPLVRAMYDAPIADALRALLADAVVLDPTLVGAGEDEAGVLRFEAFGGDEPVPALQRARGEDDLSVDYELGAWIEVPAPHPEFRADAAPRALAARIARGGDRRSDGDAELRIDFEPSSPPRLGFVLAPFIRSGPFTLRIRGEIEYRVVAASLRDPSGALRSRTILRAVDVGCDRVLASPK